MRNFLGMKRVGLLLILLSSLNLIAQNVGISESGATPNSSAGLDVDYSDRGFLLPRMTTANRDAISSPAQSLMIFNTSTSCLQMYMGSRWANITCNCMLPGSFSASSASNITPTSFDANWSASADATTYYLDVDDNSDFSSPLAGYNNLNVGNVVTYNVTGLTCGGTTYYYRVRAGNSCGDGANTATISATTSNCFIVATGGTITTDGNFKVHTFNSSGTFQITSGTGDVDYLVIAGGGGGSSQGGGGAGGYREDTKSAMGIGSYTVTVGAGGAGGGNPSQGANGGNSVFDDITSIGGGAGGAQDASLPTVGGSGGGGYGEFSIGASAGAAGTAGQGNAGGAGISQSPAGSGGGGGGAGSAGTAATSNSDGGEGGNGLSSSITGSAVTRAGGGGGGSWNCAAPGIGGSGGGGNGGCGAVGSGTNGTANTGSGGGGGWGVGGGNGGSGVVILRYQYQ